MCQQALRDRQTTSNSPTHKHTEPNIPWHTLSPLQIDPEHEADISRCVPPCLAAASLCVLWLMSIYGSPWTHIYITWWPSTSEMARPFMLVYYFAPVTYILPSRSWCKIVCSTQKAAYYRDKKHSQSYCGMFCLCNAIVSSSKLCWIDERGLTKHFWISHILGLHCRN